MHAIVSTFNKVKSGDFGNSRAVREERRELTTTHDSRRLNRLLSLRAGELGRGQNVALH